MARVRPYIVRIAICCFIIVVWEMSARKIPFLEILFSRPSTLAIFVRNNAYALLMDTAHTSLVALGGLICAVILAFGIGSHAVSNGKFGTVVEATSTIMQTMPLVVFAPFLIIIFGVGYASKIALTAIIAIFPIIIGFISSAKQAIAQYEELALFYDVPPFRRVVDIYFPAMLPQLVGHVRVGGSLALLGAVIAEFTGSSLGLGRNIFLGTIRIDPELLMSSLILTGILGGGIHFLMTAAEHRAAWWLRD